MKSFVSWGMLGNLHQVNQKFCRSWRILMNPDDILKNVWRTRKIFDLFEQHKLFSAAETAVMPVTVTRDGGREGVAAMTF